MRALLDINLLIALLDASHAFHDRAHAWWAAEHHSGWASCPLTENGAIRVMTNPAYSASHRFTVDSLIGSLSQFVAHSDHEFWTDSLTLRDRHRFAPDKIHGGRQLTDLYLLALAGEHSGRLATFDQNIPSSALKNASPERLCVIR